MDFWHITLALTKGLGFTALIFLITLIISLPLGLGISFGSMSKIKFVSAITKAFVWVIRGTPLMLQIIFFTFGPNIVMIAIENLSGNTIDLRNLYINSSVEMFIMVCIAFSINYACYFSEIFRGGIQSVPRGQYEAADVLGMTKSQTFSKVIFLQLVKRIIPPMSNEIITLVKDTALASVAISVDLFTKAKEFTNIYASLFPIFYAGLFYLVFNGIITIALSKFEKKLNYFKV